MRVLVQRSLNSSVSVDSKVVGSIENGLVLFVGFTYGDSLNEINYIVKKIVNLRIFDDENGVMNKSILDVKGNILSISQFTLYANTNDGNRPSFTEAMHPDYAKPLYLKFNEVLRQEYDMHVETGIFGAHMILDPVCDGPVTIELEF